MQRELASDVDSIVSLHLGDEGFPSFSFFFFFFFVLVEIRTGRASRRVLYLKFPFRRGCFSGFLLLNLYFSFYPLFHHSLTT